MFSAVEFAAALAFPEEGTVSFCILLLSCICFNIDMMSGFMSYFVGRKDTRQTARAAIVELRQQLQMLEKKEEHLQKRIDEEVKNAKSNAVKNKAGM